MIENRASIDLPPRLDVSGCGLNGLRNQKKQSGRVLIYLLDLAVVLTTSLMAVDMTVAAERSDLVNANTFISTGHPKSSGVDIGISYPSTWVASEGRGPQVMQVFISDGGLGDNVAIIVAGRLPTSSPPTRAELDRFFKDSQALKRSIPAGAEVLDIQSIEIDGLPAAKLEFVSFTNESGQAVPVVTLLIMFVEGSTMVQVQFYTSAEAGTSADQAMRRYRQSKSLFLEMVNSITLLNAGLDSIVEQH